MSHVDEGTLHAYIDGELPPPDRAAVDAHLAQCAACRASLAEARALVERASALLGAARPTERPAPPLEQLRRASKRSPWHVRTQFAWAASIALALGVGYLLRNPTREYALPDAPQPSSSAPIEIATNRGRAPNQQPPPRTPALVEQKSSVRGQTGAMRRAEPVPADEVGRAKDKPAQEAERVAAESEVAPTVPPRAVAATPAPAEQHSDSAANVARVRDSVFRQRLGASPVHLDAVVVTGNAAAAKAERDSFVDDARVQPSTAAAWPVIDRRLAKSLLGEEPVGLPGLAVRAIRIVPGADRTVVVEQAIDPSSVIQVFQRPATTALSDSSSASLKVRSARERPDNLLARYVGRLRVEIVGPVSLDSLNRLLEQVRPLP